VSRTDAVPPGGTVARQRSGLDDQSPQHRVERSPAAARAARSGVCVCRRSSSEPLQLGRRATCTPHAMYWMPRATSCESMYISENQSHVRPDRTAEVRDGVWGAAQCKGRHAKVIEYSGATGVVYRRVFVLLGPCWCVSRCCASGACAVYIHSFIQSMIQSMNSVCTC